MEILIFITWFLALCSAFVSFFFDSKRVILMIQVCTLVFFWSHMYLLWALAWAWFLYIQIARNIFFSYIKQKYMLAVWVFVFATIYIIMFLQSSNHDTLAFFPFAATILWTLWCYLSNTTQVRFFFLMSTIPFNYYMLINWSLFAIAIQMVFTSSILINICRFDLMPYFKKLTPKK